MTTIGEEVVRRLNEIESNITQINAELRDGGGSPFPQPGMPVPPSSTNRMAMEQLAELRRRLDELESGSARLPQSMTGGIRFEPKRYDSEDR